LTTHTEHSQSESIHGSVPRSRVLRAFQAGDIGHGHGHGHEGTEHRDEGMSVLYRYGLPPRDLVKA